MIELIFRRSQSIWSVKTQFSHTFKQWNWKCIWNLIQTQNERVNTPSAWTHLLDHEIFSVFWSVTGIREYKVWWFFWESLPQCQHGQPWSRMHYDREAILHRPRPTGCQDGCHESHSTLSGRGDITRYNLTPSGHYIFFTFSMISVIQLIWNFSEPVC